MFKKLEVIENFSGYTQKFPRGSIVKAKSLIGTIVESYRETCTYSSPLPDGEQYQILFLDESGMPDYDLAWIKEREITLVSAIRKGLTKKSVEEQMVISLLKKLSKNVNCNMAIVVQTAPSVIPVYDMKDGDVAVIVEVGNTKDLSVGTVVQRSGEGLILIGERSCVGYPLLFSDKYNHNEIAMPIQVSKLSKGTTIML